MSFIDQIYSHLVANPGKTLVSEVHGDHLHPATGAQIIDRADRIRGTLEARKVKPGDRVVLVCPNSNDWVATDLGLLAHGVITVPLYARQDPAELVAMMKDCDPALVLVGDEALGASLTEYWADMPVLTLQEAMAAEPSEQNHHDVSEDDIVTIIYTSGTSGEPKGVMLSRGNVDYMLPITASSLQRMMGPRQGDDRVFHYLPFCFAGSRVVLWTCLYRNNPIMASTDLDNLAQEFGTAKPNYFLNVPALLERIKNGVEGKIRERALPVQVLYDRGKRAYSRKIHGTLRLRDRATLKVAERIVFAPIAKKIGENLECLICGSAPLGEDTQRWFEMLGIPVYQVYGLTETTAIATMDRPPEPIKPGRVGPLIDGCEARVTDDGELQLKSPGIFKGYWNRKEATEAAFDEGWFRTGDQAEVDGDGNWRIIGRVKNLLVPTSGHNVAPEPIEQRIVETIEGVEQAVVIGHARPYLTAIITGDVGDGDIQAGLDRINQELPHYRRIRKFHLDPEPFTIESGLLTATQKLRRTAIEAHYADALDALYGEASADRRSA